MNYVTKLFDQALGSVSKFHSDATKMAEDVKTGKMKASTFSVIRHGGRGISAYRKAVAQRAYRILGGE